MHFRNQNSTVRESLTSGILCFVGVGLITWCAIDLCKVASKGGSSIGIFAISLMALGKGIAGVICLAPSLTRLALIPVFRLVDSIFCPKGYEKKPPLDYRLADYYRRTRQFDLAMARYAEIVRYYPGEAVAYAWLFVLAEKTSSGNWKSKRILRRARRRLRGTDLKVFERVVKTAKANWQ